ncbi:MAG: hypothetical protein AB7F66_14470 [Bacteriovoracia bacterium]
MRSFTFIFLASFLTLNASADTIRLSPGSSIEVEASQTTKVICEGSGPPPLTKLCTCREGGGPLSWAVQLNYITTAGEYGASFYLTSTRSEMTYDKCMQTIDTLKACQ